MATSKHMKLPIESYMFSDDQRQKIVTAKEHVIRDCMRRQGFAYTVSQASSSFKPESLTALRYGITSLPDAENLGYRPKGSEESTSTERKTNPVSKEWTEALQGTGKPHTRKNQTIPAGGCVEESRNRLHDTEKDGGGGDAEISNSINAASWNQSFESKEVEEAFSKWSTCMKNHGFRYADPMESNNDAKWRRTKTATRTEKRVAATDVRCKNLHDVVEIWYTSDKNYQKNMIAANIEQLEKVRQRIGTQVRLAEEVLESDIT
ncbi:hypothetical protein [Streptomyces parvulus]|uniref:hypothetical protein n=1 Tax=Streptomyces parvulus TaxID=146923 RepID=UPI001CFB3C6E|nr:hypothetical protein [Streptomyces parvulus]